MAMRRAAQSLSSAVRSPPLLRLLRACPAQAPSGDDLLPLRTRAFVRRFSSSLKEEDEIALEEEAQKKAAWLFKSIFILTAGFAAYQFFPYMGIISILSFPFLPSQLSNLFIHSFHFSGDNLLHQSISLLRVRDPLFKRMGASRLTRYAVDDERRMRVVEMGGAKELLNVLQAATDDKTRKETLKALVALSKSDEAARFLHQAGAVPIVSSISNSSEFAEVETHKTSLLEKFEKIKS
ncbi:ARM repeat superfamily protein [Rhynchospora pubera]|uniref:ARM repeat superfamily protein n=1 Tax=Rhynchospora pubera TaxID=906938 RepID=A0AAV8GUV4_9POAL|nr:ARM repeat superfamily protein [Rhynchospora pubera]